MGKIQGGRVDFVPGNFGGAKFRRGKEIFGGEKFRKGKKNFGENFGGAKKISEGEILSPL